ncbi:MAG: nucleoside triphosphate pyrophosphohydrolase [Actinomycetota bacterium]
MSEGSRTPSAGFEGQPVLSRAAGQRLLDLVRVMHRLRGPDGCPWDREQTHESLARHLLEEAHEALEAIDAGDLDRLKDELGDVLLQVVFHAEMGRQSGTFDIDDVAEAIVSKLVRRHPHVFGDVRVDSAAQVLVNWEHIKEEEKGEHAVDEEIPATLPALGRAAKVQRRAAGAGFDWRTREGALGKVHEELQELEEAPPDQAEHEVGDLLFAVAALARRLDVDPETALRKAVRRFSERFEAMKALAREEGVMLKDLSEHELLARWAQIPEGSSGAP